MVKLRLSRTGRKGEATYRIIAVDSNRKRDTKALENVGYYLPHQKTIEINKERVQYWLSVGAQPTATVQRMFVKQGLMSADTLPTRKFADKAGQKNLDRKEAKASKLAEGDKAE